MTPGPHLDAEQIVAHNQRNRSHTFVLGGGMALLILLAAGLLAGWWGLLFTVASLTATVIIGPRATPDAIMRAYGGVPVPVLHGRPLVLALQELARRAGLSEAPELYLIPSSTLNAFAVGTRRRSAIALTEGLVRRLQLRELTAVLAHEISHIRNGDLWIMGLADGITRIARVLSMSAVVLMLLNIVSVLTGGPVMSWAGLLLLYLMPAASGLLQQALSRTREYDADLDGVTLTGDAAALASALTKLEADLGHPWEDLVYGMRRVPQPSILRSHPTTAERVRRLQSVSATHAWPRLAVSEDLPVGEWPGLGSISQTPRYRWRKGVWY